MTNIILDMITNTTSSIGNFGSGGMVGIFTVIALVGICVGIIALLAYVSSSIEKYRRFKRLFHFTYKLFSFSAYGILTVAVVGLPLLGIYQLSKVAVDNPSASIETLKTIGIIVGLFIGVTLVGYCTKNRIWKRLFTYHSKEKQERKHQEIKKELIGAI